MPLLAIVVAVGLAVAPVAPSAGLEIGDVDTSRHPTIDIAVTVTGDVDPARVADELVVSEEGRSIDVVSVRSATSAGMEIVLLVDGSGSMRGAPLAAAQAAARGFVEQVPPDVRIGVVSFGSVPEVLSAPTRRRSAVMAGIDALTAEGETALYDAVGFAVRQFSDDAVTRRLILLSDGGDTVSFSTLDDAVRATRGVDVDVVELVTDESNRASLDGLATAGHVRSVSDPALLSMLYDDIASSLSRQFVVRARSASSGPTEIGVSYAAEGIDLSTSAVVRLPDAPPPSSSATVATTTVAPGTTLARPSATAPAAGAAGGASDSSPIRWIGAAAVIAGLALLVVSIRSGPTRSARIRERLASSSVSSSIEPRRTLVASVEDALERRGRLAEIDRALRRAGMANGPGEIVMLTVLVAIVVGLLLAVLLHPVVGILAMAATPFVVRGVVRRKIRKRREAFVRQLPDVLQLIQSMLVSGFGLLQALKATSEQVAEPARSCFAQVMFAARSGRDVSDALHDVAEEMQSSDFDWVVTAVEINREIGGDLSSILASVAEGVRERQRLRGQVKALTAEGRLSAYVMLALPPGVLAVSAISNPEYASQLFRGAGLVLLAIAVLLMGLGYVWMRRMIDKVMG